MNTSEVARSAILGALVGDALGVPFEFKAGHDIPPTIDMLMPAGFPKTYSAIPYGTWSDDGAQLLCLLDSLLFRSGEFDSRDFADRLLKWHDQGWQQSGGTVFDCGLQTSSALERLQRGVLPEMAGSRDDRANGNGSLMRVIPVAVVAFLLGRHEPWLIQVAENQSLITHGHEKSRACCAVYTVLAYWMMNERLPDLEAAIAVVAAYHHSDEAMQIALLQLKEFGTTEIPNGSGYVIDSLWSAWSVLQSADCYAEAVTKAIRLGNDTDTTACIAGGLAGIRWGIGGGRGIPSNWISALRVPEESRKFPGLELFP